jgi:hypothetical protein
MSVRVEFTADHPIVVDDDPVTGEEIEHIISAGSVLEVDGVLRVSGEEWADVRVPGYEDITTPVPVREGLCCWYPAR